MSDVILLVLRTGEHILGTVVGELDGDEFELENLVTFGPSPDGKGLGTIPYLQLSEEISAKFSKEKDVRHILTPKADLLAYYNEQFGNIVVPDSKIML